MFVGKVTEALVSKVAKIIPGEVCSEQVKPGMGPQDHCHSLTYPNTYINITELLPFSPLDR